MEKKFLLFDANYKELSPATKKIIYDQVKELYRLQEDAKKKAGKSELVFKQPIIHEQS